MIGQVDIRLNKADVILNIKYSALQACYWFTMAAATIFVVALLRQRGFSNIGIGIILAVKYLSAVVAQLSLSKIVDKLASRKKLKRTIQIMAVVSFAASLLMFFVELNYWATIICFIIFGSTINGAYPFINALSSKYNDGGRRVIYSYARGIGSLVWGLSSLFISFCVDISGIDIMLVIQSAMLICIFIIAEIMDDIPGNKKQTDEFNYHSYSYIFRNYKGYVFFLLASCCIFIANNLLNIFMIDIVNNVGGGNNELGYIEMALAIFELISASIYIILLHKIGIKRILIINTVSTFIQMVLTAVAPNIYILITVQAFQTLGVGMYWSSSVQYVNNEIPESDAIKGMALVNIASLGVGGFVVALLSVGILNSFGIIALLCISSVIVFIGTGLMVVAMHKSKEINN